MEKVVVLGKNSFVGKAVYQRLLQLGLPCEALASSELDVRIPETYSCLDLSASVIVDCINVNNGNEHEIFDVNVKGFSAFCDYLSEKKFKGLYVYLSTISVISPEIVEANAYVRSKKVAEDKLKQSSFSWQIMRLSYPIGVGENKDRLITRLISKLKQGEPLHIQDIRLNLNAVDEVAEAICERIGKEPEMFISSNQYYSLKEILNFMKDQLRSSSELTVTPAPGLVFEPLTLTPFSEKVPIYDTLLKML